MKIVVNLCKLPCCLPPVVEVDAVVRGLCADVDPLSSTSLQIILKLIRKIYIDSSYLRENGK